MSSWCHGDRPEPVVTARPGGMEYLRSTGQTVRPRPLYFPAEAEASLSAQTTSAGVSPVRCFVFHHRPG
jgi:hypothetical protein